MYDKMKTIGNSLIQHGKENDRIYLMKLHGDDYPEIINQLESISNENNYTKIFAKVNKNYLAQFIENGYQIEAEIPNFYNGENTGFFLAKYPVEQRKNLKIEDKTEIDKYIEIALSKKGNKKTLVLPKEYQIEILDKSYAKQLSELYKIVFPSYPFPIHDPEFIKQTMDENVEYFGIIEKESNILVAASSAEKYSEYLNVEMTDFATNPDYLGKGLALILLDKMEFHMESLGFKSLYTIARSHSAAMNITFAKNNYEFGGTLINNTNIFGRIESMNVWYKNI